MDAPRDCPDCQSAGTVVGGTCQVCFSEGTPLRDVILAPPGTSPVPEQAGAELDPVRA